MLITDDIGFYTMNPLEQKAFIDLFRKAYEKCFNKELTIPISETESKHFSNEILEQTGLVIGWKTIKNYSFYILNHTTAKQENPSVATLDTFARYIAKVPKTDEINRKRIEGHFPYWYAYRDSISLNSKLSNEVKQLSHSSISTKTLIWGACIFCIVLTLLFYLIDRPVFPENFTDEFNSVNEDSLSQKGWIVKDPDTIFWNKRNIKSGHLTLYALEGDTYPDRGKKVGVKNILLKEISTECFSTEIHLTHFIPNENWQQAGIILMEDTTFLSKSIRLTIAYNDFFGGYARPGEILIQAISSINGGFSKPEEIAHTPLFTNEPTQKEIIKNNLQQSALRIEKNGHHFRFLYATGASDIFAFKEVVSRNLVIAPKYVGIFAFKGFVKESQSIPVYINSFNLKSITCEN